MGRARQKRGVVVPARRLRVARSDARALWVFLAAVFVVKLVVMVQLGSHPLLQPESGLDSATYTELAGRVLRGDVALGDGLYYVSPLYIYFLAAILGVNESFTCVRIVQIALGTCAVWFVFLTARTWFGARAGWIAAALAALTGVFTFYEIVVLQSALDTFLTSAALYGLARALVLARPAGRGDAKPSVADAVTVASVAGDIRRLGAVTGIAFGLQMLNRPNVAIPVAGILAVLFATRRVRLASLLAVGIALALAPVVIRNIIVSHQFALVSSQGGLNLYIGNNPTATGQYSAVPGVRANIEGQSEDTRRVAEGAVGHSLTDAEVSSYFTHLATSWTREHPGVAARLFVRKLALVVNRQHQWLDFSYPYYAYDTGSILGLLFAGPWLLVPLGLAGLACTRRDVGRDTKGPHEHRPGVGRSAFLVWSAFIPLYAVSVAVFFVAERYRMPLFVPLCVTAGPAVETILDAVRIVRGPDPALAAATFRGIRAPVALFVIGAIITAWPFHLNDGRYDERLRLAKVLMNEGDFGRATFELENAHRLDPSNSVAEFNLGIALMNTGRSQEGVAHIRDAVDAGVPVEGARYALARAMLAVNRNDAVRLLQAFSPSPTDSAESCYQVAVLALDAGAPDVAERFLDRALVLRPAWPEARQLLRKIPR